MAGPIELAVERDLPFQRRQWVAERIGWTVMAVLLLAALTGILGRGPLSKAQASHPDGLLTLEYEWLARFQAPSELRVHLRPAPAAEEVFVSIPQSYLEGISVQEIEPEPASVRLGGDHLAYRFLVEPGTQSMEVRFRVKMETVGRLAGSVASEDVSVSFRQFIFP
jgi:hypothetical protein